MRGSAARIVAAMTTHRPADFAVSSITTYELFTGVNKCANPARELKKVEQLLDTVHQVDFGGSAAKVAARIRAELESRGEMIGPYDILIAGHALSLGHTLITSNANEFARVPGLSWEDWSA